MSKKARQRVSYVLENEHESGFRGGHRLGVNGLSIDSERSILYTGGRDGVLCAWDLNFPLTQTQTKPSVTDPSAAVAPAGLSRTTFRAQTQAHMHWVNDVVLTRNNTALVSASSDLSVKVWLPHSATQGQAAYTLGHHADYVKCIAAPPPDAPGAGEWVASGALGGKITLWDLAGNGSRLEIDAPGEEVPEKGSVYALAVGQDMIASGGPESVVKLWDPRSGTKINKLVGHTDMIRAILLDDGGDTLISASSDRTIKIWDLKEGRCISTLYIHNASVWSLYAEDPRLGIFYSGDRSGLIVKTDVRGTLPYVEDGLSVAIGQEHDGVGRLVACNGHVWTATAMSSINRWKDVDNVLPESDATERGISEAALLRLSSASPYGWNDGFEGATGGGQTRSVAGRAVEPVRHLPEETTEGLFGVLKCRQLNDRRHVLALDTSGEVSMWDLIKCRHVKNFGKRHLGHVFDEVDPHVAVPAWCAVDTSFGNLVVTLDPHTCFDAEGYLDEMDLGDVDHKEDQRVNLGKWVLRYLFANLIDTEIRRDEAHRQVLSEVIEMRNNTPRPSLPSVQMPPGYPIIISEVATTPRANPSFCPASSPGAVVINAGPPVAPTPLPNIIEGAVSPTSPTIGLISRGPSQAMVPLTQERQDYFAVTAPPSSSGEGIPGSSLGITSPATPVTADMSESLPSADYDKDKDKTPGAPFSRKFSMKNPFGRKRSVSQASEKPPTTPGPVPESAIDERAEEESESSAGHDADLAHNNFFGMIRRIRADYDRLVVERAARHIESRITPSLPSETPVLKLSPNVKILIQEETSGGGLANIYQGTVGTVGRDEDVDVIEKKGALWLAEVLLQNAMPVKENIKVSFFLTPGPGMPVISGPDSETPQPPDSKLNANRVLRVRKILMYVAERLGQKKPAGPRGGGASENNAEGGVTEEKRQPGPEDHTHSRVEDSIELYCNDQLLDPALTLGTVKAYIWKGGPDMMFSYRSKGLGSTDELPPGTAL